MSTSSIARVWWLPPRTGLTTSRRTKISRYGYVVDTLRSARRLMCHGSFEEVVKSAVRLGHDTDTTAAVAGGVAGVIFGVQGIPERWRNALRAQALLTPLFQRHADHGRQMPSVSSS
jgi:ADP-ribosylglycohydrolase